MKLQQVLINVLGNAVKFTDKGKISLEVHPVSQKGKLTRVRFIVNDTGRGIKEEFLTKIFEPFEQGDNTTTTHFWRHGPGSGHQQEPGGYDGRHHQGTQHRRRGQ
jgi:signal transduction histidine kinase